MCRILQEKLFGFWKNWKFYRNSKDPGFDELPVTDTLDGSVLDSLDKIQAIIRYESDCKKRIIKYKTD